MIGNTEETEGNNKLVFFLLGIYLMISATLLIINSTPDREHILEITFLDVIMFLVLTICMFYLTFVGLLWRGIVMKRK